jgi:O-acetyl-ADP-ribose deacetylase (regulator of RNase III)
VFFFILLTTNIFHVQRRSYAFINITIRSLPRTNDQLLSNFPLICGLSTSKPINSNPPPHLVHLELCLSLDSDRSNPISITYTGFKVGVIYIFSHVIKTWQLKRNQFTRTIRKTDDMKVTVVDGDLLDQDVEVIVNAWNRNIIPWWLLIPQGVSGAIKRRCGLQPFRELGRMGAIPLGHAVETSAGSLPFKAIIHVAGINMLWRSTERSIRDSVRNALEIARNRGYESLALPLIGAGSGGGKSSKVQSSIEDELTQCQFDGEVRIVRYCKTQAKRGSKEIGR